jgi:3-oxoacyl-(acyl-carrier-protein) synthase III
MTAHLVASARHHARLLALGAYRPARIVDNEEASRFIDSSDDWIRARSGIVTRRYAADETVPEMAARAASKALSAAGVDPQQVSCVIVASMSYPVQAPPAAASTAAEIGAARAAAFDLGAACAGFSHALAVANSLVCCGTAEYVVVAGAERMTDIVDPTDRGTAFLFGDGAGAAVVGRSEEPGFGPVVWGSETEYLDAITQPDVPVRGRNGAEAQPPFLRMAGRVVFRWAVNQVASVSASAIDGAGLTFGDIAAFIPHQANARITDAVIKRLGLPTTVRVAKHVVSDGNTSAASIPLAFEAMMAGGELEPKEPVLIAGFGAGLGYSAQVVAAPG